MYIREMAKSTGKILADSYQSFQEFISKSAHLYFFLTPPLQNIHAHSLIYAWTLDKFTLPGLFIILQVMKVNLTAFTQLLH